MIKKSLLILYHCIGGAVLLFFAACNHTPQEKATGEETHTPHADSIYQQRIDSLVHANLSKDTLITDLFTLLVEIQDNSEQLHHKKLNLLQSTRDLSEKTMEAIKEEFEKYVKEANKLLTNNKTKIRTLQNLIDKNNLEITQLNKSVIIYEQELNICNKEVAELNNKLKDKNLQISELEGMIAGINKEFEMLGSTIRQQEDQLNTGWYCVADKKVLLNSALISKKGKVLSIDASLAKKIDIRQDKEIPINSKKPVILTAHPTGSYKIIENNNTVEKIEILNEKEFWSISKYCVVQVKN